MAMIDRNFTFATNGTVSAADLHNLIDSATIYQDLITGQLPITSVGTNYELLIADATNPNAAPNAVTVYDLFEDALTAGTYTNANISAALTYGTATGTRLVSTNATITTGTITTGVIPTLTSSTATFGTTTSTAATITSGTITSGTITNLASTTGTIATLNSTTGTITTGVIPTLTSTTLITTGTGTAASPAIVPTGDTNTGIFFPAADTIAFAEGGTEAMRIDSSGNVGIGAATAHKTLTVGSNDATAYISAGGNNVNLTIASIGSSGSVIFKTGGTNGDASTTTERLRIDPSGRIGIGTASPLKELQINATEPTIRLEESGAGSKRLELSVNASAEAKIFANQSGGILILGTVATERLRIDSSGGVTIAGLAGAGSRAVNASAAGLLSAASDASLKEEVVGASIAGLNEILQIHPKMYRWKDDIANRGENASVELGFIANDVAPIIPSAAPLGNDGLYGFYDRSITAALVKAVQELKAENDSLKSRIEALEAK